jgi:RNA polymerase sigma factor (TIGR02999 family)
MRQRPEVTTQLGAVAKGERGAQDELFVLAYDELKRIARARLRRSGGALTINPTMLLHEAWLKFAGAGEARINDSVHFYNVFAQAMRQIVIDLAMRRATGKHGGALVRTELNELIEQPEKSIEEMLALDAALDELRSCDAELAQLVELHTFAGLSLVEIAELRNVSERTVKRHWSMARAFLGKVTRGRSAGD